jgi:DNA processing protein
MVAADPKLTAAYADSNQILWLALTLTPGLGPTRSRRLVEFFGRIDRVFSSSLTELEAAGLPAQSAQSLGTGRSVQLANEEIARAVAEDVRLVAFDDPAYPSRLRQIYDPPLLLYVRGNVAALSVPGIAVVGTRHPTPYGTGMAERLACDLATRGLVISAASLAVLILRPTVAPSRAKAKPSPCSALVWTCSIPKRIPGSRSRF